MNPSGWFQFKTTTRMLTVRRKREKTSKKRYCVHLTFPLSLLTSRESQLDITMTTAQRQRPPQSLLSVTASCRASETQAQTEHRYLHQTYHHQTLLFSSNSICWMTSKQCSLTHGKCSVCQNVVDIFLCLKGQVTQK